MYNSSAYDEIIIPSPFPDGVAFLLTGYSILATTIGICGNVLIWLSIMQTSRLKTATNYLVAYLAFTDLGNCAICFPTFIPALVGSDYLLMDLFFCKIQFYLASIFSSQSAVMLNLIDLV